MGETYLVFYGSDIDLDSDDFKGVKKVNLREVEDFNYLPGNKYIILWNDNASSEDRVKQPYYHVTSRVHLGPRGEGFYDLTKMDYLLTREGILFKFVYKTYERRIQWIEKEEYDKLYPQSILIKDILRNADVRTGISKKSNKPWYMLSFDGFKGVGEDVKKFVNDESYIKKPAGSIKGHKIIRGKEDIKKCFEYFLRTDQFYGLDYETNSFPFDDPEFFVMGVGIVGMDGFGAYFDLEWMQTMDLESWEYFKDYYRKFLDKYEDSVTYNNAFEMKVTYLILNKINLFDEASTINKLDGVVYKRFSLKYTAMKNLYVSSWDDSFEDLTMKSLPKLFGTKLFKREAWRKKKKTKKEEKEENDEKDQSWKLSHVELSELLWIKDDDEKKRLTPEEFSTVTGFSIEESNKHCYNVTEEFIKVRDENNYSRYYKNNYAWDEICKEYPKNVSEFERLIGKYFGYSYKCIPAEILGEYCCKDSYYTVLLKALALKRYPKKAWDCYNNNLRLEALLNLTGIYVDEDLRKKMYDYSAFRTAYGRLNVLKFFFSERIRRFGDMGSIKDIPEVGKAMELGMDIMNSKSFLLSNYFIDESSDIGVNRDRLRDVFGEDLGKEIEGIILRTCYRIEKSSRSRKVFMETDKFLKSRWNVVKAIDFCSFKINGVDYRVPTSYESAREFCEMKSKLRIVDNYLSQIKFDIQVNEVKRHDSDMMISMEDLVGYLDENIHNVLSPLHSASFKFLYLNRFWEYIQRYKLGISDSDTLPEDSMNKISREGDENKVFIVYDLAKKLYEENEVAINRSSFYKFFKDDIMSLVFNHAFYEGGLKKSSGRIDRSGKQEMVYLKDMKEIISTIDPKYDVSIKELTNVGGYKYLKSIDKEGDRINRLYGDLDSIDVTEDSADAWAKMCYCYYSTKKYFKLMTTYLKGIFTDYSVKSDLPNKDGISTRRYGDEGVVKMYPSFQALSKKSKRWSSGMHTISSVSETKRVVSTPPGYLLSYFDISGAEVRFISYESQDPFMLDCYARGLDPYINFAASFVYPERANDMAFLKAVRKMFKTILLGKLYGMANETLAKRIGKTLEETNHIVDLFFSKATGLKKFIEEKSKWALDHPGYVETFLGDVMVVGDDDGDDKLARLGINQHIQNAASVTLGNGFFQCIQNSIHGSDSVIKNGIIRPINVVHDSSQNYFETRLLFDIYPYYHKYMSDYCFDLYEVRYEFDLEIGHNYYDMLEMKTIDKDTLRFSGDYTSVQKFMKKLLEPESKLYFKVNSLKDESGVDIPFEIVDGNFCKTFNVNDERFKPSIYSSPVEGFYKKDGGNAEFEEDYSEFNLEISRK
jgi:hypothetical protein